MHINLLLIVILFTGFISCLLALVIHSFLPGKFIKYLTVILFLSFILTTLFFIKNNYFIKPTSCQIKLVSVYNKKVVMKNTLELANFTQHFIENGYGGLLRKYDIIDLENVVPEEMLSKLNTGTILWTFEFQPNNIVYRSDCNARTLTIYGAAGKSNTIYFTFISDKIAKEAQIMFREIREK